MSTKQLLIIAAIMVAMCELSATAYIVFLVIDNMIKDQGAQMIGGLAAISGTGFFATVATVAIFVYAYLKTSN